MADEADRQDDGEPVALDIAVDQAVAACDGDPRVAVAALIVLVDTMEGELEAIRGEVERIESAVSAGYTRRTPKPRIERATET